MRAWSRLLVAGLACVLMLLVGGWATISASAEEASYSGAFFAPLRRRLRWILIFACTALSCGGVVVSPAFAAATTTGFPSTLAIEGVPTQPELEVAGEEAAYLNPEALAEREASASEYEGLNATQAAEVDHGAFANVLDRPDGGPPRLPAGQRILDFVNPYTAQIAYGDESAYQGLVESMAPMAVETAPGQWSSLDLAPQDNGQSYRAERALVAAELPKNISDGAHLSGIGLSIAPVDATGASLSGVGTINGASVLFANTERDTDTVMKFSTQGVALDAILRSRKSPHQLTYKLTLPAGAHLQQSGSDPDAVQVVKEGAAVAQMVRPQAHDAAGRTVPVHTALSGDMITINVEEEQGAVRYPVAVDPEFNTLGEYIVPGNWHFYQAGGYTYHPSSEGLEMRHEGPFGSEDWAYIGTQTKGQSKIYAFYAPNDLEPEVGIVGEGGVVYDATYSYMDAWIELIHEAEKYAKVVSSPSPGSPVTSKATLCANPECSPAGGAEGNEARFWITTTEPSTWDEQNGHANIVSPFSAKLDNFSPTEYKTYIYISQRKEVHSTTTYATSPEVAGTVNVLSGSGAWLSEHQGAFEYTLNDLGVGIDGIQLERYSNNKWETVVAENLQNTAACSGIQCAATQTGALSYSAHVFQSSGPALSSFLHEGENTLRISPHDALPGTAAAEHGEGEIHLELDNVAPHGLSLSGIASKKNSEGSEEYELGEVVSHVKVSATDGEGTVLSSGVKSLELYIDGRLYGSAKGGEAQVNQNFVGEGACSPGPCTASAEWTLNGANLGAGQHSLTIVATDKAHNQATAELTLNVYSASPSALGPGSVNPESGDFALEATDANISGGMGNLEVARHYDSRNLTEGKGGPLGRQWAISLGSLANLEMMPDGSMMLAGPEGLAHFPKKAGGGFQAPPADSRLQLEAKESKGQPTEYLLRNQAKDTTTRFTLPEGIEKTAPSFLRSFGQAGAENGELNMPTAAALDGKGDIWVADAFNHRVQEFDHEGNYIRQIGTYGTMPGQFNDPYDVVVDHNEHVWVSDVYNNRIQEFTTGGEFLRSFGKEGTGAGEFKDPEGLAVDSKNDIWVTDIYNYRLQEFNEVGGWIRSVGSRGTTAEHFETAIGVAVDSHDNVWVADSYNHRVQEFSPTGAWLRQWGKLGTGHAEFETPVGIAVDAAGDVFVGDYAQNRVQELTENGEYITQFGEKGEEEGRFNHTYFLALGLHGSVLVADPNNDRVDKWAHLTWMPTASEGPVATDTTTDVYKAVEVEPGVPVTEPILEVAPHPNATCSYKKLERGCRALEFNYAESTTATGEAPSEWGDYKGHLTRIYFIGWDPSSKAMAAPITVAHLLYDSKGNLREVWDPRVPGEPKTVYGYDSEGHVTALTPPGRESWAFTYGSTAADTSNGRLVKATQALASAEPWKNELLKNTTAPTISGTPMVGVRLAVSNGSWTGGPVAYAYQWNQCSQTQDVNGIGGEIKCTPIPGAIKPNYTPTAQDEGRELSATVTATNGGGSAAASTTATAAVVSKPTSVTQSIDGTTSLNAISCYGGDQNAAVEQGCVATDGLGKALYAHGVNATSPVSWTSWAGPATSPSEAVACPGSSLCLMAAGSNSGFGGNLYYATSLGGAWTLAYSPSYGVDAISCTSITFCVDGQDGGGYFRFSTNPASTGWTLEDQGTATMKAVSCLSTSFCTMADSAGNLYLARSTSQIESSTWAVKNIDSTNALNGIACSSTLTCVAVDGLGNVVKISIDIVGTVTTSTQNIDGTNSLTAVSCYGVTCAAVDNHGNIFSSTNSGGSWNKQYQLGDNLTSVYCGPGFCIAADTTGNVTSFTPSATAVVEGEQRPAQPGVTMEYNVPVSGAGAPYQLGAHEVEAWAQKDVPVEATAIFPPDEPEGWPASDYRRASIYYLDSQARTVNVASPGGAIATSEYNEFNDVTRSLSSANRQAALKEVGETFNVSKRLDTESVYGEEGSRLEETLGPEHKIKIAKGNAKFPSGTEVPARNHVKYYYDEGAPSDELFNEVTKATDGARMENGEEFDVRTTTTSYSGQNDLGWKLRSPTSTTIDPSGLKLTSTTIYDKTTGNIIETRSPGAGSANEETPQQLNTYGSASPHIGKARGVTTDSKGDLWIADTDNNRIEEFSPTGGFMTAFGTTGSNPGELLNPQGVAIDSAGHVWVADTGNSRIQEFTSTGTYMRYIVRFAALTAEFKACLGTEEEKNLANCETTITNKWEAGSTHGLFKDPNDITIDSSGDLFVTDTGNSRIQEGRQSQEFKTQFGTEGTGNGQLKTPHAAAIDSKGDVWVADTGNARLEEFSPTGAYILSKEQHPFNGTTVTGVAVDSEGHIWISGRLIAYVNGAFVYRELSEYSNEGNLINEFGEEGAADGKFKEPMAVAGGTAGLVWIADTGNARIQEVSSTGAYVRQCDYIETGTMKFAAPAGFALDASLNLWIADTGNNRLQEISSTGKFVRVVGSGGKGNAQFKQPAGDALDSAGHIWVADTGNNRVQELTSEGAFIREITGTAQRPMTEPVGVAVYGETLYVLTHGSYAVQEFTTAGVYLTQFGAEGSGEGQVEAARGLAVDKAGHVWIADTGNDRVQEFSSTGSPMTQYGGTGTGPGELKKPDGVQIDGEDHLWIADTGNNRVQELSAAGDYLQQFGGHLHMKEPTDVAISSSTGHVYVLASGDGQVQEWTGGNGQHESSGTGGVHAVQTIYYTSTRNTAYPECGEHIEWAGLPCETRPAAQPETPGLPPLPVNQVKYNLWNQAETITEQFGSTTRTKHTTFDPAGRPLTSEVTSSADTPVPAVTDHYDEKTGDLTSETTTVEGKTLTLTRRYDKRGLLESYTDADGSTTSYYHDVDGRVTEVIVRNGLEQKAKQTYTFDTTTGFMTTLVDSAAGTFKASYEAAGRITSETFPNNMTATYTRNATGDTTSIEYVKNGYCASTCPEVWFKEKATASIHGETLSQTSSLATMNSSFDEAGRVLEVQETPSGKGCTTRTYGYDIESNRTSLQTREPAATGACATEGGTLATHTFDGANRLSDTGVSYETFGNTTTLPSADAGGPEITSAYYVDNQLASQTQNEETTAYYMDPEGRTRETVASGKGANGVSISHYPGPGSSVSWTAEPEGKWTRAIPGIDGTLSGTAANGLTVTLQLHDLRGDVVGTASGSETETKMLSPYSSSEFGVPSGGTPPKYAWLGAFGVTSESPTGAIVQDGTTYVPQTGRPLQREPVTTPNPQNFLNQYVSTFEEWPEYTAGIVAEQVANALEARRAVEEANQPAGATPEPEENEEAVGEPVAVAASGYHPEGTWLYKSKGADFAGCSVWGSWGHEFLSGKISAYGHWKCGTAVRGFQMQIQIWEQTPHGPLEILGDHAPTEAFGPGKHGDWHHTWTCPDSGTFYHLWFWGRYWNRRKVTQWSAAGWERRLGKCTSGPVDLAPVGEGAEDSV
jgi:YD repeat-containing protein